jgi:hypothetical protein
MASPARAEFLAKCMLSVVSMERLLMRKRGGSVFGLGLMR